MLKHKGFNLSKLAAHESLPNPCSIKINNKTNKENLKELMITELEKKRYSLKETQETTRYELDIATKCKPGRVSVACAVFTELKDNYADKVLFTDMQVRAGLKKKAERLFEIMKAEVNKRINHCNM